MSEKNFLDSIFDAADAALTPLEKVLSKDQPASQKQHDPDVIDVEPEHQHTDRHKDWEANQAPRWEEVRWACVGTLWHAFGKDSMSPICRPDVNYTSNEMSNRQTLKHGGQISACTSCIIGVSK